MLRGGRTAERLHSRLKPIMTNAGSFSSKRASHQYANFPDSILQTVGEQLNKFGPLGSICKVSGRCGLVTVNS
jgi:hypothetical protein